MRIVVDVAVVAARGVDDLRALEGALGVVENYLNGGLAGPLAVSSPS